MQDTEIGKKMDATWTDLRPGTIIYPSSDSTTKNLSTEEHTDSVKTSEKRSHAVRWSLVAAFNVFVFYDVFFNGGHMIETSIYFLSGYLENLIP